MTVGCMMYGPMMRCLGGCDGCLWLDGNNFCVPAGVKGEMSEPRQSS